MNKLAIFGGIPVRSKPMPPRFALGPTEEEAIFKVIKFYKDNNQDPQYSGVFEQEFCKNFSVFMGGGYSDAVATGTGAIYIAMKACQIPPNSDVLLSPVTEAGALSCITEQGHTPVLLDAEKNSYNTSLKKVKSRLTTKTKAIQLTHSGGEPVADIAEICEFAKERGISIIEDCSQAIGARVDGKLVGTFGDVAAFSTMYRKNLSAGASSGIVFCKDLDMFHRCLSYSDRGKTLWIKGVDFRDPQYAQFPALNWNTDEFSCAIGNASLKRLEETNHKRKEFLKNLFLFMTNSKVLCKPYAFNDGFAPFYFPLFPDLKSLNCKKLEFTNALEAEGIPIGHHYGCLVATWPWAKSYMADDFSSPNAIETRDNCFHLYLNENYTSDDAMDVVKAIKKVEDYYLNSPA